MNDVIANYIARLKLAPDVASLKRVDRWFGTLESKLNKHSKRIASKMDSLGALSTGGNVSKKKRDIDTIANAHVKAYDKELKSLERRAHFENKERKAKEKHEERMQKLQKSAISRIEKAPRYWTPPPVKQMSARQRNAMYEAKARPFMQEIRAQDAMARLQSRALRENASFDARRARLTGGRPTLGAVGASRIFSAVAGAGIAGYGIGQLNKASQELEMLPVSMEAVTGSAAKAATHLTFLAKLGREVGATRMELVPEYTKMLASAIDTPLEAQMPKIFTSITKYGKVMGLDQESMKGTFKSISQMIN